MFFSMTGYAKSDVQAEFQKRRVQMSLEIRTVNSKYLDIHLRTPRAYTPLESKISALIRDYLKRGRVDLMLTVTTVSGVEKKLVLNEDQLKIIHASLKRVSTEFQLSGAVQLSDLLQFPDWFQMVDDSAVELDDWPTLETLCRSTLEKLVAVRKAEGLSLERFVTQQLDEFENLYKKIRILENQLLADCRSRLMTRIQVLIADTQFDPSRIEQEAALLVSRSDFKEEMDRIFHHLESARALFKSVGEVGRRFEFVLQELHREVNTLGSKCPDAKLTPTIIEMKTCIERMREQIQNVE